MVWKIFKHASALTPEDAISLANEHLESARKAIKSPTIALSHCKHAKEMIVDADGKVGHPPNEDIANAYYEHSVILEQIGEHEKSKKSLQKAQKWGHVSSVVQTTSKPVHVRVNSTTGSIQRTLIPALAATPTIAAATIQEINNLDVSQPIQKGPIQDNNAGAPQPSQPVQPIPVQDKTSYQVTKANTTVVKSVIKEVKKVTTVVTKGKKSKAEVLPEPAIFLQDVSPPIPELSFPEPGSRVDSTSQLAYCLSRLNHTLEPKEGDDTQKLELSEPINVDEEEQNRLKKMATNLIRAFVRDELKKPNVVAEVVSLAAVLEYDDSRELLGIFANGIDQSVLQETFLLDGLAQFLRNSPTGSFDSDDLVKILQNLNTQLANTHSQSSDHIFRLAHTVSRVLDSMVDSQVKGLQRETLHLPLSQYLEGLKGDSDPVMIFEAAYAFQALQYVPDDEPFLKGVLRRTGKVVQGISGVVSAVKAFDLMGVVDGLGHLQGTVEDAIKVAKLVYNAANEVKDIYDSGADLLDALKDGLCFSQRSAWYPALRILDNLIQNGKLGEFEELVRNVKCKKDPAFQWGVSQRLGEIASNNIWSIETRLNAISFMTEIYNDDATWRMHPSVKLWIPQILKKLQVSSDSPVAELAQKQIETLKALDTKTQSQIQKYEKKHSSPSFMVVSPSKESLLLQQVQNVLDIEAPLRILKQEKIKEELEGSEKINVYIPPCAKNDRRSPDVFDLANTVDEFLKSDKKVLLLLGDSGAGKSTFSRVLENRLWNDYKKYGRIPLLINLPSIEKPEQELISKQLRKNNFNENQIREMKQYRDFIVICDGYDECQTTRNLYSSNNLNTPGEWRAQMVITCRTEYNGNDYKDVFRPIDRNNGAKAYLFQEATIAPFSPQQIDDYIKKYVELSALSSEPNTQKWELSAYSETLKKIPSLQDLVKNPFLLSLTMEVLPDLFKSGVDASEARVTRVELYDQFMIQWLERMKKKLIESDLNTTDKESLKRLGQSGFDQHALTFLKELATAIYDKNGSHPVVTYTHRDKKTWKEYFFSSADGKNLLRNSIPLVSNGSQYQFIHKSVLEYGASLAIFDPKAEEELEEPEQEYQTPNPGRRRDSVDSTMSFEIAEKEEPVKVEIEKPLLESLLGRKALSKDEPSILDFLVERAAKHQTFKNRLHAVIEHSKTINDLSNTDKRIARNAAANAITILIRAGVQFNRIDLRGISIPTADLSYGVFDSANLEGADLRKAKLRNVWLRNADLRKAQMRGVEFGESPFLHEGSGVTCSAYSPVGEIETYAVGLEDGSVNLYETKAWKKLLTLKGHTSNINCLAYSSVGDRLVTGSQDGTVRLWDVKSGDCIHILEGHNEAVTSVSYSSGGDRIASGGRDGIVRLWEVKTGTCVHLLEGHNSPINAVVYSPKGDQIASASDGVTVILWSAETGAISCTLEGHTSNITSLAYSPNGDRLASGSGDKSVRLWNLETNTCQHTLQGHGDQVTRVVFSPGGNQVATGSNDKTVRLWDVEKGKLKQTLGHSDRITDIAYAPEKKAQIAASSEDSIVRLWDVVTGNNVHTFEVNNDVINSVVYSPTGDMLTCGCKGRTVRLWDVKTLDYTLLLPGHTDDVNSVVYITNDGKDQIVTAGDDKTVRLWSIESETVTLTHTFSGYAGKVTNVVQSSSGNQIASRCDDGTVRLWNISNSYDSTYILQCNLKSAVGIAYSPKGNKIATGYGDNAAQLWDTETGKCLQTLQGHASVVTSLAYSPKGNQVATGSEDKTVRLWDTNTGECLHNMSGHDGTITSVAYSTKGNQVASGSTDKTVQLWNADTGEIIHSLKGHTDEITTVVFPPKAGRVASGSKDNTVRLWDVETGTVIYTLGGHEKPIKCIVYSPKGDRIATGSEDWTVRLWNGNTAQCQVVIRGFNAVVNSVDWNETDEGLYLATGSDDKSLRHWKITKEGTEHKAILCWSSSHEVLTVTDTDFSEVEDLDGIQTFLLKQRGALQVPTTPRP